MEELLFQTAAQFQGSYFSTCTLLCSKGISCVYVLIWVGQAIWTQDAGVPISSLLLPLCCRCHCDSCGPETCCGIFGSCCLHVGVVSLETPCGCVIHFKALLGSVSPALAPHWICTCPLAEFLLAELLWLPVLRLIGSSDRFLGHHNQGCTDVTVRLCCYQDTTPLQTGCIHWPWVLLGRAVPVSLCQDRLGIFPMFC